MVWVRACVRVFICREACVVVRAAPTTNIQLAVGPKISSIQTYASIHTRNPRLLLPVPMWLAMNGIFPSSSGRWPCHDLANVIDMSVKRPYVHRKRRFSRPIQNNFRRVVGAPLTHSLTKPVTHSVTHSLLSYQVVQFNNQGNFTTTKHFTIVLPCHKLN